MSGTLDFGLECPGCSKNTLVRDEDFNRKTISYFCKECGYETYDDYSEPENDDED